MIATSSHLLVVNIALISERVKKGKLGFTLTEIERKSMMEASVDSCTKFHRSAFEVTSSAFPCPFVCYSKTQATFVANFLRVFLNVKEIHIRGDPS